MAFMNKYFVLYRPMALQIWITEFDSLPLHTTIHRRNLYKQQSERKGIQQPLQEFEAVLRDVLAA